MAFSFSPSPAALSSLLPFAAAGELNLMFRSYDTSQFPPLPQGQPLLLLNSTKCSVAIYVHACVCVCVDVSRREIDRVANRWTGRLVVCLSAFKTHQTLPFCDYTVYLQVWKKKRKKEKEMGVSEPPVIWERVLPEHVEGVTCSLPCFPSLSAHLVVAMGTARQRQTLHQPPWGDCENREEV